jgi:ribosome-binding factor A
LILETLQSALAESRDPALGAVQFITLTRARDGSHVRVGWVARGRLEDEARHRDSGRRALERASGYLRARVAEALSLERPPLLSFTFVGVDGGES